MTDPAAAFAGAFGLIWPEAAPVGLAVSGGADSLALLLLAKAALPGDSFAVATVDHGLRPEAAAEAAKVAAICAARGIAHATLTLALERGPAIQERARIARYRALDDWCAARGLAALVTAHHADDQAETMAMRLNRGTGVRGLAAMRPRATVPGGSRPLLRPLLGWRRAELADVVSAAGLAAIDDPSNRDTRFERVRVRQGLAAADWIDPARWAEAAAHLADADAALDWMADRLGTDDSCDPALPRALALRLLERIVVRLGGKPPRGRDLANWHDMLRAGHIATLGGVRGDGTASPWRFSLAAKHADHRKNDLP